MVAWIHMSCAVAVVRVIVILTVGGVAPIDRWLSVSKKSSFVENVLSKTHV